MHASSARPSATGSRQEWDTQLHGRPVVIQSGKICCKYYWKLFHYYDREVISIQISGRGSVLQNSKKWQHSNHCLFRIFLSQIDFVLWILKDSYFNSKKKEQYDELQTSTLIAARTSFRICKSDNGSTASKEIRVSPRLKGGLFSASTIDRASSDMNAQVLKSINVRMSQTHKTL